MEATLNDVLISLAKKQVMLEKQEESIQALVAQYNELSAKYNELEVENAKLKSIERVVAEFPKAN